MMQKVFRGDMRASCSNNDPHPPHVVSHYDTVRYGELEDVCLGIGADIHVQWIIKGDAHGPSVVVAQWQHSD